MNINGGKIVEGLAHVVSCPATDAHQKSRETALAVLSNMAITPACKHGLFEVRKLRGACFYNNVWLAIFATRS